jgi:hypothetical protein
MDALLKPKPNDSRSADWKSAVSPIVNRHRHHNSNRLLAMTKPKLIALTILIAAIAASLLIRHRTQSTLRERDTLFQQQAQQLANLKAKQLGLSNLVARAAVSITDHTAELAKLRQQADALKQQTNDLAKLSKLHPASPPSHPASKPETHTPEYWEQMQQARGTKGSEAREIVSAMTDYALDHQKQFPASLDQITPYLARAHQVLSGTNQFEIVFQGSLDQLDGIPEGSIARVRETQPWLDPEGRPTRVYGMIPGLGQTVTSDDNFQSWEAEHVISPPTKR